MHVYAKQVKPLPDSIEEARLSDVDYAFTIIYCVHACMHTHTHMHVYAKQVKPLPDSIEEARLSDVDYAFTIIFTLELLWNMLAHWLIDFWWSAWNLFDFFIIVVSLLGLASE